MVLDEFKLNGKVAIVTGAGRGLGKRMALALAEEGADVVVVSRTQSEIAQTASEIRALKRKSTPIVADVTNPLQIDAMVNKVIDQYGQIDILVNNAGKGLVKPLLQMTDSDWYDVLNTNLTGTFFCCRAVGQSMVAQRKGKVINVAAGLGERGLPDSVAFCASKGGIIQFTKALALEWAPSQVNVNAIAPGWFPHSSGGQDVDERIQDLLVRYIPLRRRGEADDLAGAVVYLASEASDFMTGETLFIDGGVLNHA